MSRSIACARGALWSLLLGLGGCASDPTAPLPLTWRINEAQRRWQKANISTYGFNSSVSCFCLDEYSSRKAVFVRNGVVVDVRDAQTGIQRPLNYRQPVDSLFALLRREAFSAGGKLTVEFDGRLGYPTRISYGQQEVDGGGVITIDRLVQFPGQVELSVAGARP